MLFLPVWQAVLELIGLLYCRASSILTLTLGRRFQQVHKKDWHQRSIKYASALMPARSRSGVFAVVCASPERMLIQHQALLARQITELANQVLNRLFPNKFAGGCVPG